VSKDGIGADILVHTGIAQRDRDLRMINYMSVGVDAYVTLNFHNRRDTIPRWWRARVLEIAHAV
jgi:hypothetical protein